MPRACPVELHACRLQVKGGISLDATALCRGASRSPSTRGSPHCLLQGPKREASTAQGRGIPRRALLALVEGEREGPRHKAVASQRGAARLAAPTLLCLRRSLT